MTRMSTRSSSRLTQNPVLTETRTRTRSSSIIILDSDSEEESINFKREKHLLTTPKKDKACRQSDYELQQLSPVTPTKQKKILNENLHLTPDHRKNKLPETGSNTPSSIFKKLVLNSPDKAKKLKKSNRKSLFEEADKIKSKELNSKKEIKENFIDKTIENELIPDKNNTYRDARRALHSTFPTNMQGRENELKELRDFIREHLVNKTSGSVYISGPPGTGKTASLNVILQEDNIKKEFNQVYVNCTAIKSPKAIYSKIVKELGLKVLGKSEKDYLTEMETYLKKNHKMILLVLDEIDQLESKNQSILYTIFEWPSKPSSRLVLVGIANALDLTDRTLPRLQSRCELKPKLMHFSPYTKQQILEIFTARLQSAGVLDVFSPVALQMLAGKVASISGDVRRALDIGRRVIELVDQSKTEDTLKSIENLANDLVESENKNGDGVKAVDLKQVVNVLNNVYGTTQNLSEGAEDTFPLQQKITLCSLILMLKKSKNKDITIGKLHEVYKRVCKKQNIQSVDQAEFVCVCSLIETRGVIRVSGKKEPRLHKVHLEWDEEEVSTALKDKQMLSMILQDDSCLGK